MDCISTKITNFPLNNLDENEENINSTVEPYNYKDNYEIEEDLEYNETIFTAISKIVIVYLFYKLVTIFI